MGVGKDFIGPIIRQRSTDLDRHQKDCNYENRGTASLEIALQNQLSTKRFGGNALSGANRKFGREL